MSASENLSRGQFEQLDMFKPAKELRAMHLADAQVWLERRGLSSASESSVRRSRKNVMQRKTRESKKSGLYDSIKAEGVKEPVEVVSGHPGFNRYVADGHHRIASAMSIDPNMLIPVKHQKW